MESLPTIRPLTKTPPRGFTLVEMVVVLLIIVIITGIVINGQSSYNQSIVLTDTAYTVAYSIRQAQSLGLASRRSGTYTDAGYGIHFGGSTSYLMFADTAGTGSGTLCPAGTAGTPEARTGDCRYSGGTEGGDKEDDDGGGATTDTIVENFSFSRGFTINTICAKNTGSLTCGLSSLDIVFRRPDTRAIMTGPSGQNYTCAEIHVRAPTGTASRVVRVSQLGEVSVGQTCP